MRPDVVLIDSGVNAAHPHIAGCGVLVGGGVVDAAGVLHPAGAHADTLGHGTAAAAAILDLAPGITLVSLKVFHDRPQCPFEHVLVALDHALSLRPRFVNLSIGTAVAQWIEPLIALVDRARAVDVVIVAPADFSGMPSYPGSLAGVAGVVVDTRLARGSPEVRVHPDGRSFWHAAPWPRDLPGLPREANLRGPSFATANVTGHLARATTNPMR